MKMWREVLRGGICVAYLANSSEKSWEPLRGGSHCGWESQRFVTLKNRAGDAAVGGHPVKRGGRCCSRGTCCVGGGRCGWEPPQVVTLKNRKMWGEARFGGTFGVEVGLPAREDMRILMSFQYYGWD